jgi:hypothetical protein
MYLGALVTIEMIYFIINDGRLAIDIIRSRQIQLGWENINIVIYSNMISIPLIAYLISHNKIKIYYMFFALINSLGIMLTLSRSSLLTLAVFIVVLIPTMIVYERHRYRLLLHGLGFLLILSIGVYYAEQYELISQYIAAVLNRDLTYFADRLALLEVARDQFLMHPIVGTGGLYSSRIHLSEIGPLNYHNTIAQASTLGAIGLIAFVYLFVQKVRMCLQHQDSFKWFLLILIFVTAFVNGVFQPMYFYTTYMFYIFLILAVFENTMDKRKKSA